MLSDLFIDGEWRKPAEPGEIEVFNPATEEVIHHVASGGPRDVDLAVQAAQRAFPGWRRAGGWWSSRILRLRVPLECSAKRGSRTPFWHPQ